MRAALFLLLLSLAWTPGCSRDRENSRQNAAQNQPQTLPGGRLRFTPGSQQLESIKVMAVKTADVPSAEVDAPGKVEVNPNHVSHVMLPIAGRLVKVLVRVGDAVRQGEPLLEIESPDADAGLSAHLQAQAALTQARAAEVKAQADADRLHDLYQHNAVALKDVTAADSALAQAKAGVEQAEASVSQALSRLKILGLKPGAFGQPVRVAAPISGKVLEMNMVAGEYRNDLTAPLATIADLSTVWIVSDVPETAIRFINAGEPVEVELSAYPGEVCRARVTRIADTVDAQTHTVKVRAELANPHGALRPEMFGRSRHVHSTAPMPVIPPGAVVQGDGRNMVFVELARGDFEQRQVEVGDRVGDNLAIRSGLKFRAAG
jgi:cobalt-zinc-cadmium efflux system membrane fusion protein